jgi:hypothetical protein
MYPSVNAKMISEIPPQQFCEANQTARVFPQA